MGDRHVEIVGDILIRRLREIGLSKLFGVAGDFNLELLEPVGHGAKLDWIGCCNELNAAYAADGHSRMAGLSALITTYGVGELIALCGVAGAFAEQVPIVSIVGAPPLGEIQRHRLLHHSAGDGDFDNMMKCGSAFAAASARPTPQNAVSEIDRCLRACVLEKQLVYLQLPSDIADTRIETDAAPPRIEYASDPGGSRLLSRRLAAVPP